MPERLNVVVRWFDAPASARPVLSRLPSAIEGIGAPYDLLVLQLQPMRAEHQALSDLPAEESLRAAAGEIRTIYFRWKELAGERFSISLDRLDGGETWVLSWPLITAPEVRGLLDSVWQWAATFSDRFAAFCGPELELVRGPDVVAQTLGSDLLAHAVVREEWRGAAPADLEISAWREGWIRICALLVARRLES